MTSTPCSCGHGLRGVPYGHFGDGCVHVRIDFDLESGPGRSGYRAFVEDGARLAASYGGSLSGEHGDGRARSELLPLMYDEQALVLMASVKRLLDPANLLNPGVLVDPAPFDADLRLAGVPSDRPRPFLTLHRDRGDLVDAVHRCTGVGRCIADNTGVGGVMCPSYQATRDEKDSTRGRARVLQDAVTGRLEGGWDSPALTEALDLCLSCKGCARDCPTGVDMATYKAEWLHQKYAGKRRPRTHYSLGRLPQLVAKVPPRLANAGARVAPGLGKLLAGVDRRRTLPRFAARPVSARPAPAVPSADVVLWVDTFTNRFSPQVADAAVAVLSAAGQRVQTLAFGDECCGLTWVSTGQLEEARARLTRLLDRVAAAAVPDVPVVALEPSCLAVLRVDSEELLPDGAPPVVSRLVTLAEHLASLDGWEPPSLAGTSVVAQPHCHHASVLGWEADEALLRRAGATLTAVGGCCGLAGNFGMEKGHYDVSVAVFEHALGPAVRARGDAVVLADGFSCRTQLDDLAGVPALHLAELLAGRR